MPNNALHPGDPVTVRPSAPAPHIHPLFSFPDPDTVCVVTHRAPEGDRGPIYTVQDPTTGRQYLLLRSELQRIT